MSEQVLDSLKRLTNASGEKRAIVYVAVKCGDREVLASTFITGHTVPGEEMERFLAHLPERITESAVFLAKLAEEAKTGV